MGKKSRKDKKDIQAAANVKRKQNPESSGDAKLAKKEYEAELFKLQVELVKLQDWAKHSGARIVIIFEGRDAAGKGGIIKRIMERVSPRVFRLVALPAPTKDKRPRCTCNATLNNYPRAVKSSSSTGAGTTAQASSM
jgi:polyphosphate kinase 2 (PPK2 family)